MEIPKFLDKYFTEKEIYPAEEYIFGVSKNVLQQEIDASRKNKKIILISGLSGSGKDSIAKGLLEINPKLAWIKTTTTREKRPEEIENDPYDRLSVEEFRNSIKEEDFLEYVEYAGNFYGTKKRNVEEMLLSNKIPVLRIDPKGASFYLNKWLSEEGIFSQVTLIYLFVVPPSLDVLKERLFKRSKNEDFVNKRIAQSQTDLTYIKEAEYIVINENNKLKEICQSVNKVING